MTENLTSTAETKVVQAETKAKSWLSRNWYPFLIGAGSAVLVIYALHSLKLI